MDIEILNSTFEPTGKTLHMNLDRVMYITSEDRDFGEGELYTTLSIQFANGSQTTVNTHHHQAREVIIAFVARHMNDQSTNSDSEFMEPHAKIIAKAQEVEAFGLRASLEKDGFKVLDEVDLGGGMSAVNVKLPGL
jgi:hypothetical protein